MPVVTAGRDRRVADLGDPHSFNERVGFRRPSPRALIRGTGLAELVPSTAKAAGLWLSFAKAGRDVELSPDELRVVTASEDGSARPDARDRQAVTGWLRHGDRLRSQVLSGRAAVVTIAEDQTARVWMPSRQPWTEPFAHGRRLTGAEFSADGERVGDVLRKIECGHFRCETDRASRQRVSYGFVITDLLKCRWRTPVGRSRAFRGRGHQLARSRAR